MYLYWDAFCVNLSSSKLFKIWHLIGFWRQYTYDNWIWWFVIIVTMPLNYSFFVFRQLRRQIDFTFRVTIIHCIIVNWNWKKKQRLWIFMRFYFQWFLHEKNKLKVDNITSYFCTSLDQFWCVKFVRSIHIYNSYKL